MNRNDLIPVNIDELKVGDTVGFCFDINWGWGLYFKYPIIESRTIKRITPKRTKFILDNNVELDVREAKQRLVVYNETATAMSRIAEIFKETTNIKNKIDNARRQGNYILERSLSDEELIEYHAFMKKIYEKYLKEE